MHLLRNAKPLSDLVQGPIEAGFEASLASEEVGVGGGRRLGAVLVHDAKPCCYREARFFFRIARTEREGDAGLGKRCVGFSTTNKKLPY